MSAAELVQLIGREGLLDHTSYRDPISTLVVIRDARVRFGNTDVLVEPVAGRGRCWVTLDRVKLTT